MVPSLLTPSWREQYDRMLRWHARISQLMAQGETRDAYNERIADYLHAFFVTCHHLMDWLSNDPSTRLKRSDITRYVHGTEWLSRCVDVANGSKHAVLKKGRVAGGTAAREFPIYGPESGQIARIGIEGSWFAIEGRGREYDAMRAVDLCVHEWGHFLRRKGLI